MQRLTPALYYQIFDLKPGRGEEKKVRILEAFIRQVATKGLDNISFETLGKEIKMQRTHIAYYFPNRDELIRAAVRYTVAMGQRITIEHVEKAKDWKGRLKAVVEGPFLWIGKYPDFGAVMAMFYYLCSYHPGYRELQNSIRQLGEDRIASCLEPLMVSGKMTRAEVTHMARAVQNHVTGTLHNLYCSDYPVSFNKVREQTVNLVLSWLPK